MEVSSVATVVSPAYAIGFALVGIALFTQMVFPIFLLRKSTTVRQWSGESKFFQSGYFSNLKSVRLDPSGETARPRTLVCNGIPINPGTSAPVSRFKTLTVLISLP
jgi:hypothetical protein